MDQKARDALLAAGQKILDESNDPAALTAAAKERRERAEAALEQSRPELIRQSEQLEEQHERRASGAAAAFREAMEPDFRLLLRDRREEAAEAILSAVEKRADESGRPFAPWIRPELEGARSDLRDVNDFWRRLRTRLKSLVGQEVETLQPRDGSGTGRVKILEVDGWTLRYRDPQGNDRTFPLRELKLRSALRQAGLDDDDRLSPEERRLAGTVRFLLGEEAGEDLREEIERKARIYSLLLRGESKRHVEEVDRRLRELRTSQDAREKRAEAIFEKGVELLRAGRPRDAKRELDALGDVPANRHTEFFDKNRDDIEYYLGQCEAEISGKEVSRQRFSGGRFRWLSRHARVMANLARAEISWRLDAGEELGDLGLTDALASIRAVPASVPHGPSPEDEPAPPETKRRVLVLHQGEVPDDYRQRHPIVIDSPFLATTAMTLEVDVMMPRPVFFAVSLAGYGFGILSQGDREEGGRGIAHWMASGFENLDHRLGELRTPYVLKALEKAGSPGERRLWLETRYFQMEPARWYRLRFERGDGEAVLRVDGRTIGRWDIAETRSPPDRRRIMILTYTTTLLDNLRIEGTVDRQWWEGR
jgi:hypothetical protein